VFRFWKWIGINSSCYFPCTASPGGISRAACEGEDGREGQRSDRDQRFRGFEVRGEIQEGERSASHPGMNTVIKKGTGNRSMDEQEVR
jgi:hypothetical protein